MDFNRLYQFFSGRNGIDFTFYALAVMQLALIFIGFIARIFALSTLYLICQLIILALMAFMIFRIFSKNLPARSRENQWMIRTFGRIKNVFSKIKFKKSKPTYSYSDDRVVVVCPSCGANIRVKNIRGSHGLNCPKCGRHFDVHL